MNNVKIETSQEVLDEARSLVEQEPMDSGAERFLEYVEQPSSSRDLERELQYLAELVRDPPPIPGWTLPASAQQFRRLGARYIRAKRREQAGQVLAAAVGDTAVQDFVSTACGSLPHGLFDFSAVAAEACRRRNGAVTAQVCAAWTKVERLASLRRPTVADVACAWGEALYLEAHPPKPAKPQQKDRLWVLPPDGLGEIETFLLESGEQVRRAEPAEPGPMWVRATERQWLVIVGEVADLRVEWVGGRPDDFSARRCSIGADLAAVRALLQEERE